MAWPQAPQPAPAPQPPAGPKAALDVGALITAAGGVLTFLFSFVRIYKVEGFGDDVGWSVWTTDFVPGLFGVGTWIPFFALVAGALALARAFLGLGDKEILGFKVIQLQLVAAAFAVIQWLGFVISILFSGSGPVGTDVEFGLGTLLLFVGLALVAGGTVFSLMGGKMPAVGGAAPGSGQWPAPTPPPAPGTPAPFPQPGPGSYGQPAPGAAPAPPPVDPASWNQPPPGAPAPPPPPPAPDAQQWQQPSAAPPPPAPGQWQPDPSGGAPVDPAWPAPPSGPSASGPAQPQPQPPGPTPEPGPQDPQPAPPVDPGEPARGGGALIDPGTQVIPGPPPAPPREEQPPSGGLPPLPPSNTP